MDPGVRRWLWIGLRLLVAAACIGFLAVQVREVSREMSLVDWLPASAIVYACLAAPVFAATAWLLAFAWQLLLRALGQDAPLLALARTLFLTQPAKYLPGNVGHHVGRLALARRSLQVPVGVCIASLMQEGALLCLAAMLSALACVVLQPWSIPAVTAGGWETGGPWLLAGAIGAGLAVLALVNAVRGSSRLPDIRGLRWMLDAAPSWPTTVRTTPLYMVASLLNGAGLLLLALPLLDSTAGLFLPLTAAFALSWVVGFVVPGAPGGLGVREAALVLLLEGVLPRETVLAIALMSRLSMTLADALIFLSGLALPKPPLQTSQA